MYTIYGIVQVTKFIDPSTILINIHTGTKVISHITNNPTIKSGQAVKLLVTEDYRIVDMRRAQI